MQMVASGATNEATTYCTGWSTNGDRHVRRLLTLGLLVPLYRSTTPPFRFIPRRGVTLLMVLWAEQCTAHHAPGANLESRGTNPATLCVLWVECRRHGSVCNNVSSVVTRPRGVPRK